MRLGVWSDDGDRDPADDWVEEWRTSDEPDVFEYLEERPDLSPRARARVLLADQRERHRRGLPVPLDEYLRRHGAELLDSELRLDLVADEICFREARGDHPDTEAYLDCFPELSAEDLRRRVEARRREGHERLLSSGSPAETGAGGSTPQLRNLDELLDRIEADDDAPPHPSDQELPGGTTRPRSFGRYRILESIGRGGFARVWLAEDLELDRRVAIKTPIFDSGNVPGSIEAYLREARLLARLEHPGIVPVYDFGRTPDGGCFLVEKFVEGSDLASRLDSGPLPPNEAAAMAAAVAEALHHVHRRSLVHRDIKPGNILLDSDDRPILTDFGLALGDEDMEHRAGRGGTPAYMSPEQAGEEGHLMDGRSDVFSLGVVLYEMLTDRLPFVGATTGEVIQRIREQDPRPPRQLDDTIPAELERICLKALAKRAAERYRTALDLAEDLQEYLRSMAREPTPSVASGAGPDVDPSADAPGIVPKGLRSYDGDDADFFLRLLPGPRDRDGLPESIRFWKSRIEQFDRDQTFRVGLIYGPSGSGKSSLVKAGILPRLSDTEVRAFVEATPGQTEEALLRRLRRICPDLAPDAGLTESLREIRQRQHCRGPRKLLIVIDQFEQWLHSREPTPEAELVRALRQCNGERIQALLVVRDDFWMAVVRFLRELEVLLLEGRNSAAVDLFDLRHATNVLEEIGRAYRALPPPAFALTRESREFLHQATRSMAVEESVSPARIALFSEVMKGREWTRSVLRDLGGVDGVGVRYLEEAFDASSAPPEHRAHQRAVRRILAALLPESGDGTHSRVRTSCELEEASGYRRHPRQFESVMRILDGETRLATPVDRIESAADDGEASPPERRYRLTHDHLIPCIREWLTRRQKATLGGRLELRLSERAKLWRSRPEKRQLPSWWEWLAIRLVTRSRGRGDIERRLMRAADRHHLRRTAAVIIVILTVGHATRELVGRAMAVSLRERLLKSRTEEIPALVAGCAPWRPWLHDLLETTIHETDPGTLKYTHCLLALLPEDPSLAAPLARALLERQPDVVEAIRRALAPHGARLAPEMWHELETGPDPQRRLCAACALAAWDPGGERWVRLADSVVADLVSVDLLRARLFLNLLRPVRERLLPGLHRSFRGAGTTEARRVAAAMLGDAIAGDSLGLLDLVEEADPAQLGLLLDRLAPPDRETLAEISRRLEAAQDPGERRDEKGRANLAAALSRLGAPGGLGRLLVSDASSPFRARLVHVLSAAGVPAGTLVEELRRHPGSEVARSLLLDLGEYDEVHLPLHRRQALRPDLGRLLREHPDASVHAATEWLLRRWGLVELIDETLNDPGAFERDPDRGWFVGAEGHTMVVLRAPEEAKEAAPVFALGSREVTLGQFLRFEREHRFDHRFAPDSQCPASMTCCLDAMRYCRWLSERERVPEKEMCYPPLEEAERDPTGYGPVEGWLSRTGYRLRGLRPRGRAGPAEPPARGRIAPLRAVRTGHRARRSRGLRCGEGRRHSRVGRPPPPPVRGRRRGHDRLGGARSSRRGRGLLLDRGADPDSERARRRREGRRTPDGLRL